MKIEQFETIEQLNGFTGLCQVPDEIYLHAPGISQSSLKKYMDNAGLYQYEKDRPYDSDEMRIGRIFDAAITGDLLSKYFVLPECDKRTKEGKAIYAESVENNSGKIPISKKDFEDITSWRAGLYAHPELEKILDYTIPQVAFFWEDFGSIRKGKMDFIRDDGKVIIDLKTTRNAKEWQFSRDVVQYGYHYQAAWYRQGMRECGANPEKYYIISVEKNAVGTTAIYELDQTCIDQAEIKLNNMVEKFINDKNIDIHRPYYSEIRYLIPKIYE